MESPSGALIASSAELNPSGVSSSSSNDVGSVPWTELNDFQNTTRNIHCLSLVAGGCQDPLPLLPGDVKLSKLIRLLNVFGESLNGSPRRATDVIRSAILSRHSETFEELAENMDLAIAINIFLHHLETTVDPLVKVDAAISIQSLQDSLSDLHGFDEEEWTVENSTQLNY
jgi:hypothetical protein